jgi:hypothetical protein
VTLGRPCVEQALGQADATVAGSRAWGTADDDAYAAVQCVAVLLG